MKLDLQMWVQAVHARTLLFKLFTISVDLNGVFCFMLTSAFTSYQHFTLGCTRSSCPEVFCKKYVLRNFTKFTRKYQCQSLIFNKVAGLRHRHSGTGVFL